MTSVQIKRDRTGSSAKRRPTITTRNLDETVPMSSSNNTISSTSPILERNQPNEPARLTPAVDGQYHAVVLGGSTLHEEPDNLSVRSSRKGSRGQFQEDVPIDGGTSRGNSTGVTMRGVERQRNRSRTIDCILGPPAISPGLMTTRNRTGTLGPPVIEDPTSVDLLLPASTERHLELRANSTHRKSVSSSRAPGDGYPPVRTSQEEEARTSRPRTGSIGWMKQAFLGGTDQHPRDEEKGLTTGRESRKASSTGGEGSEDAQVSMQTRAERDEEDVHRDEVVDHLNVIDAQVSAVTYLQDAANAIMIPPIPSLFKSKATITLDTPSARPTQAAQQRRLSDPNAPQGLESESTEDLLDTHVKDVLSKKKRSPKKEWFVRSMKGAWAFVKTPIGIITAIYGFLVAFWGAAIVLFLLGWIDTGSKENKDKWVEISSQVTNGLFTVTGVGFIPWRVRDAYRISAIWRLQHIDRRLRKKRGLPDLMDKNEAPDPETDENFVQVLTDKQQERLKYQQRAFGKSQTWYRPHATDTHRAFSLNWALWICLFTIGNSVFQCFLCGTMWGLNRHERPAWTTGTLIPLSFLCGIASAVLIWKGQDRSKKVAEVEKKLRDALGMEDETSEDKSVEESTRQRSREVV